MNIELNNKKLKRININESELKKIIEDVLEEELGSFKNQYNIGKLCVSESEKMLNNGVLDKRIKIPFDDDIDSIRISITPGSYCMRFITVSPDDNSIVVEIGELNLIDENSKKRLASSISHELMHGNVNLKIYHNVKKNALMDIPDYYEKLFDLMAYEDNTLSYYFAYAIYSTYFQEKNAFISQVSGEILDNYFNGNKKISIEEFKKLYAETNSVIAYKTNIEYCEKINKLNNNSINEFIIKPFKKYGIVLEVNDVREKCNTMIEISRKALKDCRRNAMIAFNRIKDDNGFI